MAQETARENVVEFQVMKKIADDAHQDGRSRERIRSSRRGEASAVLRDRITAIINSPDVIWKDSQSSKAHKFAYVKYNEVYIQIITSSESVKTHEITIHDKSILGEVLFRGYFSSRQNGGRFYPESGVGVLSWKRGWEERLF